MTLVIGSLQLGFLYGILALGIYGSDGGGEFYAGTGSLGGLHAGGASGCRDRGSSCGWGAGRLCDRRTPDEDGDSCGISWHPHNVRALHHQPDCDGKQPEYFPHQCSDHI